MDDELELIAYSYAKDAYGVDQATPTSRWVFAQVDSVTRREFYDAGRNGLNPEFKFTVFADDYGGETVCRYREHQYSIYRAYHIPGTDYLELIAERKGGSNAAAAVSR